MSFRAPGTGCRLDTRARATAYSDALSGAEECTNSVSRVSVSIQKTIRQFPMFLLKIQLVFEEVK
jgi:hypothetical protein